MERNSRRVQLPVRNAQPAVRPREPRLPIAGLTDNVAGMLAYVTIIPAIVFLVLEPYNKRRFIRFHSFQCIFFAIAWTVLWIGLGFIGHIPVLGWERFCCGP